MEEPKNNDKKGQTRNMERTMDGKKDVRSERRSGSAKFKAVDA